MNKKKIYCYADESGQDKRSKIFVVGIVAIEDKEAGEEWAKRLDKIRKAMKWYKTNYKNKIKFLQSLEQTEFKFYLYVRIFTKDTSGQNYDKLFLLGLHEILKKFKGRKINLTIDGKIKKVILLKIGSSLRQDNISTNKVKAADDHKVSLIRTIDSVVGAVRDHWEGENKEIVKVVENLIKKKKVVILQ